MKIILIILLFVTSCFSQENKLTTTQIDSICLKSNNTIVRKSPFTRSIKVNLKNQIKTLIGSGEARTKIFRYLDNDTMNIVETYKIIKVIYKYEINFSDTDFEHVLAEFYYQDNKINFLVIENQFKNGKSYKSERIQTNLLELEKNDIKSLSFLKA